MLKQRKFFNALPSNRVRRAIEGLFGVYEGTVIPGDGSTGYAPGSRFTLTNAVLGQAPNWVNQGSQYSALFVPEGPVLGYGIKVAGGPVAGSSGSTAQSVSLQGLLMDTDIAFAGHEASDDNDQIVAAIANEGSLDITVGADPLSAHSYVYAGLRNKCVPDFDIVAAGTSVTAGGTVDEEITVSGVLATDIAFANYGATDDTDTISDVVCGEDKITVTCSADPGTAHSLHYVVLRPRGAFKPSHYVAYAGVHTTTGGAAAEAITVSGAAATDIPIVVYNTTNDTDSILKVVVTEDTVTVTCSVDPATAHKLAYMLLRSY